MRNAEEINREIKALKAEREQIRGTSTEVYTRIVGYYRSVRNWNKGKREEFNHRITFSNYNESESAESAQVSIEEEYQEVQGDLFISRSQSISYLYFYRQTCPNCPPVKKFLEETSITGREIDVDSAAGLDEARALDIMASPTVILLDNEGNELLRSSRVEELKEMVPATSVIKEEAVLEA